MWKDGPSPFRFENMWLRHKSFKQNVKSWWEKDISARWAGLKLQSKLTNLKEQLKNWNRETSGNITMRKEELLQSKNWIMKKIKGVLPEDKRMARIKAKEEFQEW